MSQGLLSYATLDHTEQHMKCGGNPGVTIKGLSNSDFYASLRAARGPQPTWRATGRCSSPSASVQTPRRAWPGQTPVCPRWWLPLGSSRKSMRWSSPAPARQSCRASAKNEPHPRREVQAMKHCGFFCVTDPHEIQEIAGLSSSKL